MLDTYDCCITAFAQHHVICARGALGKRRVSWLLRVRMRSECSCRVKQHHTAHLGQSVRHLFSFWKKKIDPTQG
jgi:hypothetical protein